MTLKSQAVKNSCLSCQDLEAVNNLVYIPSNLQWTIPIREAESAEYGAYRFQLNGHSIIFRVAKTTPTKAGQFVTLWKRSGTGPIQPFDVDDAADFFVICVRKDIDHFGQFVFPKAVLHKHNIVSIKGEGGKRAIRVYPPWETSLNAQAQKTQRWQAEYFLNIPTDNVIDTRLVCKLYSCHGSL